MCPSCLLGVHALLRKLQFLFELPSRLTKCVELGAYGQAVRYQGRARAVLQQYQHLPSFRAIQDDCQVITARLAQQLRQRFRCGFRAWSLFSSHIECPPHFFPPLQPTSCPHCISVTTGKAAQVPRSRLSAWSCCWP